MSYGIEKMQISFIYSLKKNSIIKDKRKSIMETVKVLNIDIQNITRQELLENLKEGVLVTPNLDHLIKLQKDSPDTNYLFHSLILYTDTSILSNFLIKD